jgi:AraC-like DNA-binding protein
VDYRQRAPHARLARFVEAFWSLSGPGAASLDPIFPDGHPELIVHRRAPFMRVEIGRPAERQATRLFAGQMRAPAFLLPGGDAEVIGVRFRPQGAAAFLPVPLNELTDAIVEVEALQVRWLSRLSAAAESAASIEQAIDLLEQGLLDRVGAAADRPSPIEQIVEAIITSAGRASIDRLASGSSLGRRQLERRFNHEVGVSPKTFARILRFQAALVSAPEADNWSDVAHAHGYADQSHLIRDFKALTGQPPTRLLRQAGELTRIFLSGSGRGRT